MQHRFFDAAFFLAIVLNLQKDNGSELSSIFFSIILLKHFIIKEVLFMSEIMSSLKFVKNEKKHD